MRDHPEQRERTLEALSGLVGLLQLLGHHIPDPVWRDITSNHRYKDALRVLTSCPLTVHQSNTSEKSDENRGGLASGTQ